MKFQQNSEKSPDFFLQHACSTKLIKIGSIIDLRARPDAPDEPAEVRKTEADREVGDVVVLRELEKDDEEAEVHVRGAVAHEEPARPG